MTGPRVHVLECDPELGLRVPPDEVAAARDALVAPVRMLERGVWQAPRESATDLGALLLEGVLARDVLLAGSTCTELLGPGDLVAGRPASQADLLVPHHVELRVVEPVTLAVLDAPFSHAVLRWPQVVRALLDREQRRSSRAALHAAVLHLSPVETRLLMILWLLAERWGRVTPEGVVLTLRLSHRMLGRLVGCQRASLTTALHRVEASGLADHRPDRTWLLHGRPPDEFAHLHWAQRGAPAPLVTRA